MSRWLVAALVIAASVVVIRAIAPETIGEQVRRHLVKQLQDHYSDFRITIGRGRYEPKVGLIFDDIRVAQHADSETSDQLAGGTVPGEILRIERLIVVADTKPEKLLNQESPLVTRRVVVDGVHASAVLAKDGTISLMGLWPPPSLGPGAPRMDIKRAKLRVYSDSDQSQPIDIDVANLTFGEQSLVTSNNEPTRGEDGTPAKTLVIQGSSSFAKRIQITANVIGDRIDVRGIIQQARLNADLIDRMPAAVRAQAKDARGLDCVCDIEFAAIKTGAAAINYKVKTTVHDGRFGHPSLPAAITSLRGVTVFRPTEITIEASQGMLGDAICRLHGKIDGYGWPMPATLNVSASGLLLDDRLAKSLPPKTRVEWDKLKPNGRIDVVNASITHNAGTWSTAATVDCKGVDVRIATFPYPVGQLVGRVEIRDGIATCKKMDGRVSDRRLQCGFQLPLTPELTHEKVIVMATDGPIAIDNTLIGSLTQRAESQSKLESFVRSLSPRGAVHLVKATFRTNKQGIKTRELELNVTGGHLRYSKFAYPLFNVSGKIKVENELVKLAQFHGTNANAGQILCDGTYQMPLSPSPTTPGMDSDLQLQFRASSVPMDESLRSSLPTAAQETWDSISPSGVLDYLNVNVMQRGAGRPIELNLTAAQNESEQVTNRALRIQPTALPYRLDVTGGTVHYDGSTVEIESLKGRHDGTRISANGGCKRNSQGQWLFSLNIHSGSRLEPNAELIAALPHEMRGAMHQLQLRGPVNIRGRTDFLIADEQHPKSSIDWDVVMQLEGNRIGDVGPVHSLRGELSATGRRDQYGLRADGFVRIDSMHVNELQLTAIRGPYSVRDDRLQLGAANQSIQGKLFDGTIDLTGDVTLSSSSFDVAMKLKDGQVPTLLADLGQGRSELSGTFKGNVALEGILGTTDLLKGAGSAEVSGANLYQLPLLVQLLNLLRITPTEDVAFTDAKVSFGLVEDQINFDELKLWGDLVSLSGAGTMNWRRELDLKFSTQVSPNNAFSRLMRPLRSQQYTIWDVDVRGPLNDPVVQLRPLEGVGQTLGRIIPGFGTRSNRDTTRDQTSGPSGMVR